MLFRQLFDAESSTYTYLLAARAGGEALLIDRSRGDEASGSIAAASENDDSLERHGSTPPSIVVGRELLQISNSDLSYVQPFCNLV